MFDRCSKMLSVYGENTKMYGDNLYKNLELSVSCSIIILDRADGGDAVRVGASMLQT